MKYIITLLLFVLSLSVSAQWNEVGECNTEVPATAQDSVFVVLSDSREAIAQCRGTWRSIEDAGLPRYKSYVAFLSQAGTSAPDATVLFNTLGATLTWSYSGVGIYTASASADAFTAGYTPQISGFTKAGEPFIYHGLSGGETNFEIRTYASPGGALADDKLFVDTSIEIRVYYQ